MNVRRAAHTASLFAGAAVLEAAAFVWWFWTVPKRQPRKPYWEK